MKPTQCRMARAGLGWSLDDLAALSGVNRRTILNFENEDRASPRSIAKLRETLEGGGVVFIERGVYLGGVVPPQ